MTSASIDAPPQRHLFEYRFNGSEWGLEITAANSAEAQERLKALAWAQYKGRIFAKIPVASGRMIRFAAFLKNILGKK
jgi:hypothetical protein